MPLILKFKIIERCLYLKKIGFIVNPIAGMGGKVGLKGTDNLLQKALEIGAEPEAHIKASLAIKEILNLKENFIIYTGNGKLGANILSETDIPYNEIKLDIYNDCRDTKHLCNLFLKENIDLILFAGGDGTARDILDSTEGKIPVIGIPAGVKIHSGIFANRPREAGVILNRYIKGELRGFEKLEVMDIDENLYREGIVASKLYGYLNVPYDTKLLQGKKSRSLPSESSDQQSIAWEIIDNMEKDILYIVGPGSTTEWILNTLNIKGTLIGFDAIYNKKCIGIDLNEKDILKLIEKFKKEHVRIILTPIGGQGIILGRGNQQISSKVLALISKDNIIVAASKHKLMNLRGKPFIMDIIEEDIVRHFRGYLKVVTGYREYAVYKVI